MSRRDYVLADWRGSDRSFSVIASTSNPVLCTELDKDGNPVEYWEALESWDLSGVANALAFESHATGSSDGVIGTLHEVEQTGGELRMRVALAPLSINERTAVLEKRIKAGFLRGVSVGYTRGVRTDELRNGVMTRVYRGNILHEVSLVPLPADPDALVRATSPTSDATDHHAPISEHFDARNPSTERKAPTMTKPTLSPVLRARDEVARRQAAGPRVQGGRLVSTAVHFDASNESQVVTRLREIVAAAAAGDLNKQLAKEGARLLEQLAELFEVTPDPPRPSTHADARDDGKGSAVLRARAAAERSHVGIDKQGRLRRGGSAA